MTKRRMSAGQESGGVSIFIVIFTALLMTIVTTSFIQIMVRNQQQATNNDLSQSAYDAALAGVEDAKRLLLHLDACQSGATCSPDADDIKRALDAETCDTLEKGGIGVSFTSGNGEVAVGQADDNQAYTCVKIQTKTPSVEDTLKPDDNSKTISLKGTEPFKYIQLSWYKGKDIKDMYPTSDGRATNPSATYPELPKDIEWKESPDDGISNTPPILRAQLIQYKKGEDINLEKFSSKSTSNARTTFLYPSSSSNLDPKSYFVDGDSRLGGGGNVPKEAHCDNAGGDSYKCSVVLELPNPEGGSEGSRVAYLQLAALYLKIPTSFQVKLLKGSDPNNLNNLVDFDNVQPVVDSTGRASDLFRRVRANVSINSVPLSFPDAALNVNGDVCKNFVVTDRSSDYTSNCGP